MSKIGFCPKCNSELVPFEGKGGWNVAMCLSCNLAYEPDEIAAQQSVQSDGDDIEALGRQARMIADQQAGNRSGLRPRR